MKRRLIISFTVFLVSFIAIFAFDSISKGDYEVYQVVAGEDIFPFEKSVPTIGIIDTGVQVTHQFLQTDHINQIYLDEASSYSQQYHGTMVAGILLGTGKGKAPSGLFVGSKVISIQAGTDMGMTSEQLAAAIDLAVEEGAKVLNISLGTTKNKTELESSVKGALKKGVVIVASNGNDSGRRAYYPASYEGVISVGAIDHEGTVLNKSDIGKVDVFSLGDSLKTAVPNSSKVSEFNGNSAAAPIVTSVVAIILSQNPGLTPEEIKNIILETASNKKVDGELVRILNVKDALKAAQR